MAPPLELLTARDDRIPSFLTNKWNPLLCSIGGFGMACYMNWATRRPVFSGIQKHIGFTIVGGFIGKYFDTKLNEHVAERDAVLRHYIELHPDDFPTPERVKYGDRLDQWVPVR